MTSLQDRPSVEDRIIAATRAAASIVPDGSAPPLQLPAQPHPPRRPHRPRQPRASLRPGWPGWPRASRLAAPLAATAAVIAVVAASVAIADRSDSPAPIAGAGLAGVPRYYLELAPSISAGLGTISGSTAPATTTSGSTAPATSDSSSTAPATSDSSSTAPATSDSTAPATVSGVAGPGDFPGKQAVIRDTLTGATVAVIRPPRPFDTFVGATAAADDRTFVLAAQSISNGSGNLRCGATKLFRARFNPAAGKVTLTSLRVPEIPGTAGLDGIALSPDGTRLAVALEPGQDCPAVMVTPSNVPLKNLASEQEQVSIYALPGGTVKTWHSAPPWSIGGQAGVNDMSWADGRMLAFNYPGVRGGPSEQGLWLLNTNAPGGSLLAASRFAVSAYEQPGASHGSAAPPPGHWAWNGDGVQTPDGTTVVAPMERNTQHPAVADVAFGEFSASTGDLARTLWPEQVPRQPFSVPYYSVLWSNSSGSVLVVVAPAARGKKAGAQSVYGVLHTGYGMLGGPRFTPIPGLSGPAAPGFFTPTIVF